MSPHAQHLSTTPRADKEEWKARTGEEANAECGKRRIKNGVFLERNTPLFK
jgi:hypothetical protein